MNGIRESIKHVARVVVLAGVVAIASPAWTVAQEHTPGGESASTDVAASSQPAELPSVKAAPKTETAPNAPETKPTPEKPKREPAIKGYCPAAYLLSGKAVKGDAAYQSNHAGELYYLSSAEAKEKFDANPEKYAPQFGGICTTAFGGPYGNRLPSDPEVFDVRDGKVYLFSSERAKRSYNTKPDWVIARAERLYAEPSFEGYCLVSFQHRGKALRGQDVFAYVFRGRTYWLSNLLTRRMFIDAPEKYLPEYGGYCAEAVQRGKRYPADPQHFVARDGRTYFFFDAKAKLIFLTNSAEAIKKADASWAALEKKD